MYRTFLGTYWDSENEVRASKDSLWLLVLNEIVNHLLFDESVPVSIVAEVESIWRLE